MNAPDWNLTGETVAKLRQELAEVDEAAQADFEAFARFIKKELGEYKIDIAQDEWAAYHGLAFMSLIVYLARNNYENDAIDHETAGAVTAIARGVAMVLAGQAPVHLSSDHPGEESEIDSPEIKDVSQGDES